MAFHIDLFDYTPLLDARCFLALILTYAMRMPLRVKEILESLCEFFVLI